MKRLIGFIALTCATTAAFAQAPFTIVRPADGSKVREDVRVLVPKNSIPKGGYIGFFVGGKFLEAIKPPLKGRYYEYTLNTKGRGIPDGPVTLEAVLYVDYNGEPRIVDRSSVDIVVANKANIPIPESGFSLRYKFQPNTQYVYTLMQRVSLSSLSGRQAQLGAKAAQLPLEFEKIRMLYSVDNVMEHGDGLVRMQPLPLRGKDYIYLTPQGETRPRVFSPQDVYPIYMRLTNTGTEVFGSIPAFIPFEGLVPEGIRTDLFAAYPLPTLPTKRVRPGDVWQTRFQLGEVNINNPNSQVSVIQSIPARGEFAALEWEMGHPCARLVHKMAVGNTPTNKISIEETIWFALDKGRVIKTVRTFYQDTPGQLPPPGTMGPNNGGGTAPTPNAHVPPPKTGGPRRGGQGSWNIPKFPSKADLLRQHTPKRGGQGGGVGNAPPPTGNTTPPGGGGSSSMPPRPNGHVAPGGVIRLTVQQIFVLEQ